MGVKHLALAVMALTGLVMPPKQVGAIELGELQAVPSSPPPYVFRLSIIFSRYESADIPAVTVRQPRDVLSFVKHNLLELRLPALTDVELEIKQGEQTLNRLLLKSELQAARARLESVTAPVRPRSAGAKDHQSPAAEVWPLTVAAQPPDPALLEHELHEIRQEIHTLVGRVRPWEGLSTSPWSSAEHAVAPVFTLTHWGVIIVGLASFFTGYLMRRTSGDGQPRRGLAVSNRRLRGQLMSGEVTRHPDQRAQPSRHQPNRLAPVAVMRRVRVSQKTQQRLRVRASRDHHDATQATVAGGHTQIVARLSQTKRLAPGEVVEALGHLRCELIRLQRRLPHVTNPESSQTGSKQPTR